MCFVHPASTMANSVQSIGTRWWRNLVQVQPHLYSGSFGRHSSIISCDTDFFGVVLIACTTISQSSHGYQQEPADCMYTI